MALTLLSSRPGALYVVANGQGSPCLDLRRVPDVLAGAAAGADLVIIEGMGRAVHTNLRTKFRLGPVYNSNLVEKID